MPVAAPSAPPFVTVEWVEQNFERVTLIDTRNSASFSAQHLRSSHNLPLDSLLVEDTRHESLHRLARAVQRALGSRGIDPQSHLVLVDAGEGSAGLGLYLCQLAGASAVSMLRGGLQACAWAGLELVEGDEIAAQAAADDERGSWQQVAPNLESVAPLEDVQTAGVRDARLVDARSQLEHEGLVGSPCCQCRGHIPGSLHLEWASLLDPTGQVLAPERIREQARQIGLSDSDEIIVYCHSGVRSALAALALRSAGFERVRNYLGSWHEWSHRGLPAAPEQWRPQHGQQRP